MQKPFRPLESKFYSAKEQGSVYDFQTDSDAIDAEVVCENESDGSEVVCEDEGDGPEVVCEDESDGPEVVCENESDGPEEASENDSDDKEDDEVDNDYEHLQVDEGHESDEQNDDHKCDDDDDDENDQRNSHRPGRLSSLLREYLKNGGCCSNNCLIKYKELATKRAYAMSQLRKATKKAVILGMLAMINVESKSVSHGERSRRSFNYCLDWTSRICYSAFCAVTGFKVKTMKLLQKSFSENDVVPQTHGNSKKIPHHALSLRDKSIVVNFIRKYAEINGLPDPGRLKGPIRDYVLESNVTMREVYNKYCQAIQIEASPPTQPSKVQNLTTLTKKKRLYTLVHTTTQSESPTSAASTEQQYRCVSYITFTQLWHRFCSNIKFCPSKSDLCDVCDMALVSLRHSLSEGERIRINTSYIQHITEAKVLREAYNINIDKATLLWRALCRQEVKTDESRNRSSYPYLNTQMQYSFDFCQNVSIPYSSQQRGTFYFVSPRKVQIFGVCCEPLCRQVFFLIDESEQIGKGSNSVVSLLHAFFELHGIGETYATLQADNCVGQNKNKTMMWYLAWRTITDQHHRIDIQYMLPGHTKFRPDSYFGIFKRKYRMQNCIDTLDELVKCVEECGKDVSCIPQLCSDWSFYNWDAYLSKWFIPSVGINKYHIFCFDNHNPGVMMMKNTPDDEGREMCLLKQGIKIDDIVNAFHNKEMPQTIVPKGLTLAREQYLYDKVSKYVHSPSNRDKVCPKPNPFKESNIAHPTVIGPDIMAREECNMQGPSCQSSPVSSTTVIGPDIRAREECDMQGPSCQSSPVSSTTVIGPDIRAREECDMQGPSCQSSPVSSKCNTGIKRGRQIDQDEDSKQIPVRKRRKRSELEYNHQCPVCSKKYASYQALYLHKKQNHPLQ